MCDRWSSADLPAILEGVASIDDSRSPHWRPSKVLCSPLGHAGHTERGGPRSALDKLCHSVQPLKGVSVPISENQVPVPPAAACPPGLLCPLPSCLEGYSLTSGVFCPAAEALCLVFTTMSLPYVSCPLAPWTPVPTFCVWPFGLCYRGRFS